MAARRLALDDIPEVGGLFFQMRDQPALADLVLSGADGYFLGRPSSTGAT